MLLDNIFALCGHAGVNSRKETVHHRETDRGTIVYNTMSKERRKYLTSGNIARHNRKREENFLRKSESRSRTFQTSTRIIEYTFESAGIEYVSSDRVRKGKEEACPLQKQMKWSKGERECMFWYSKTSSKFGCTLRQKESITSVSLFRKRFMWPPNVTLFASRLEDHVSSGKREPLFRSFHVEAWISTRLFKLGWIYREEIDSSHSFTRLESLHGIWKWTVQCEGERVISLEKQICLGVVGSEGSEPSERWGWKYPHYFSPSSCSQTSRSTFEK